MAISMKQCTGTVNIAKNGLFYTVYKCSDCDYITKYGFDNMTTRSYLNHRLSTQDSTRTYVDITALWESHTAKSTYCCKICVDVKSFSRKQLVVHHQAHTRAALEQAFGHAIQECSCKADCFSLGAHKHSRNCAVSMYGRKMGLCGS